VAALVLGTAFLGFGVAFAAERSRARASRLFLASVAYLPLLLGALVLF
jgi:heme O synthase-like polyprenyltransferase